ncbi:class I SAM-dependent methyltransferase [Achromobacter sp. Marseille-Q4954]|uniref:class I SAM-dependent methyltransferase n=1 Tax=Achromobacter sp. Marseille-Q4954 TaxID=2942203 RepID=UPI00207495BF|nr:class I SAM-dependent methyltransferase [Achromobacter sp. Marseille-Q4954]
MMKDRMNRHRVLYEQRQLPTFQNRMYTSRHEALTCPKGDVVLVEDLETGLIYNAAFDPTLMTYDEHYQNEQAHSPKFQAHLASVAEVVERGLGRSDLVEVGCGKGYFLEKLRNRGIGITGFDPAYEGDNPDIKKHYFQPGTGIRGKGIVLRHVLEHVQDPLSFLGQLKQANGGHGRIYIEVPCFDWICARNAWFDVFYEHVNYFRLTDFERMFGQVIESGRLFGGQYIYIVAELASLRAPTYQAAHAAAFPENFTSRIAVDLPQGRPAAVWGGASKGLIFTLLKNRAGQAIHTVIDINPAKQGQYLAATGVQVRSPKQALSELPSGSVIYVMNSNYLDEIRAMSNNAYEYIEVDHECAAAQKPDGEK